MSEQLTKDHFEPYVNESFQITLSEEHVIEATLHSVRSLGKREPSDLPWLQNIRLESFVLLFLLPLEANFQQGNFNLSHEKMGEFVIFLVPVGMDTKSRYYEAVFN